MESPYTFRQSMSCSYEYVPRRPHVLLPVRLLMLAFTWRSRSRLHVDIISLARSVN